MEVAGLNLKVTPIELPDSESPDTSNAFYYHGQYGHLGPRQGKTSVNRPAGNMRIAGIFNFKGPWGNHRIVGSYDGWFFDDNIIDRGNYLVGARSQTTTTSPMANTINAPSTSGSTTGTFTGGVTYDARTTVGIKLLGWHMYDTSCVEPTTPVTAICQLGLIVNGTNTVQATYTITYASSPLSASSPVILGGDSNNGGIIIPAPSSGTISGVYLSCSLSGGFTAGSSVDFGAATGIG